MSPLVPPRSAGPALLLPAAWSAGPGHWCRPDDWLPLPCGAHHVLIGQVRQAPGDQPLQVTAPRGQRRDLAQGSIDRVLLRLGLQHFLRGCELYLIQVDQGLGHLDLPPLTTEYIPRTCTRIYRGATAKTSALVCRR